MLLLLMMMMMMTTTPRNSQASSRPSWSSPVLVLPAARRPGARRGPGPGGCPGPVRAGRGPAASGPARSGSRSSREGRACPAQDPPPPGRSTGESAWSRRGKGAGRDHFSEDGHVFLPNFSVSVFWKLKSLKRVADRAVGFFLADERRSYIDQDHHSAGKHRHYRSH